MKTVPLLLVLTVVSGCLVWLLVWNLNQPPALKVAAAKEAFAVENGDGKIPLDGAGAAGLPAPTPESPAPVGLAAECERILAMSSPAQRQLAFAKLLNRTRSDAGYRAILDVFAQLYKEGKRNDAEWFAFWAEMVARDPVAAVALTQSYNPDPDWQAGVARILAHEWALKDPQAAIAWLDSNHNLNGKDLDRATLALISGFAERDVRAASSYALSVIRQDDPLFGDMAYILSATAMQQGGKDGLLAWFDALPDESLKHRLFPSVSNRLERISMQDRAAWLAAQASSTYRNDLAYRDFVGAWAKEDPKSAMEWVFSLPPSPRDGTLVGVGYAAFPWLEQDAAGFSHYYQRLTAAQQQEVAKVIRMIVADPKFPEKRRQVGLAFLSGLK